MKYNFHTIPDRSGAGAMKWDQMRHDNPDVPEDIVPLSVADMEFENPPELLEAISECAKNSVLGYTAPTDKYYESVINWMKRRHSWEIQKDWIVEFPGVVPALFQMAQCLTEKGDGIIIMPPVYYPFRLTVETAECSLSENKLIYSDGKYTIDFDDLEKKVSDPKNCLLILCNPHNPVGRVWTREELTRVGEICIKNNVTVICDEIHHDLIMPGYEHICFASVSDEFAENSIICTAPSKTFNIAGMQVSNIIIKNEELRKRVKAQKAKSGMFGCGILSYEACRAAYDECEEWLDELIEVIEGNRIYIKNFIDDNISEIEVVRLEGTYLQWIDCRSLNMSAEELEIFMQKKALLFLDEGYIFGKNGEGFERINLACPRFVLESAMQRLQQAVRSL